jgi:hypothetical protein
MKGWNDLLTLRLRGSVCETCQLYLEGRHLRRSRAHLHTWYLFLRAQRSVRPAQTYYMVGLLSSPTSFVITLGYTIRTRFKMLTMPKNAQECPERWRRVIALM